MKISAYLGLLLSICTVSSPAGALSSLEQDVAALKEDVQVLQRQLYRAGNASANVEISAPAAAATASSVGAEAQLKISEYDEIIRNLNGRMDTLEYQVKQLNLKIDKFNRDMEIRFKILEGRQVPDNLSAPVSKMPITYEAPVAAGASRVVTGSSIQGDDLAPIAGTKVAQDNFVSGEANVVPTELPKVADGPQPLIPNEPMEAVTAPKPVSAEEMYASGMQALNNNYPDEAELAFEHILKEYPNNKLAGNAQYWLGEVYYKKGDFNKAKLAFKNGYEKYKNGNKAADSLYKLGMTFKSLKEDKNACIIFSSFDSEFPKANADLAKKVKAEAARLKCK